MKTNLIIVEGLPGGGKSTTAAMIADELSKKGKRLFVLMREIRNTRLIMLIMISLILKQRGGNINGFYQNGR